MSDTETELVLVRDQAGLDELPVGSIIRTSTARVAVKCWQEEAEPGDWYEAGRESEAKSWEFDDYPILVTYRGGTVTYS